MRLIFCLFLAAALLSACGQKPPEATIEERVVYKIFGNYVMASVYDEMCNNKSLSKLKPSDPVFVNYFGNMQLLAARVGGLWHVRHPDKSVEDGVQALLTVQKTIADKTRAVLGEKGCKSAEGKDAANAFKLFSTTQPVAIYGMIDGQIKKEGGTVTPPNAIDSANKKATEKSAAKTKDQK